MRWREWKYHVKRDNYDIYTNDEERLAIVPDRVISDQWRTLVQYWGQESVRVVSKKNSINRENLGGYHKMGRTSFRSVRLEVKSKIYLYNAYMISQFFNFCYCFRWRNKVTIM